ncbi:NAD-dependent dihydropyrimidine dehydrogenase PreA subunit [Streptomyces griseochromogenes]|uniref:NAD-dependent dihydropyrimidine dehydrogenase PreA subunit n=1 Tax=Streptomyces griseochromogenes TaxID=68214 RepID=A0ABS4LVJ8_9ACTN|nr:NAD-dependent dihydropyrimidine dehydrogenase PreA subunit [Streptomyces griseochromogenes]
MNSFVIFCTSSHTPYAKGAPTRKLLASSVDLSTTPRAAEWIKEYEAKPDRFGPGAARLNEEPNVDNELYVRDYDKCALCYKCVDACGDQWQNTFAISVAGRGFDARIAGHLGRGAADGDDHGVRVLRSGLQPHAPCAGQ